MNEQRTAHDATPPVRLAISLVVGAVAAVAVWLLGQPKLSLLVGWDVAAALFCGWMWATILPLDPRETGRRAGREDPGKAPADVLLLFASVASLVAVGFLLVQTGHAKGAAEAVYVGLGVLSVVLSWCVVHTRFTLHYARLFYGADPPGGVDFSGGGDDAEGPSYLDFAYLAFTIGMTFQVSDTSLQTSEFRKSALQHALLSYLFGTVIVATTINLVAGLGK